MNRSWVIWLVASVCALLVLVAMTVLSMRVLDAESERIEAADRADQMERVRLALWRLESSATAVLVAENQRLPEEYQSYYSPNTLWSVEQGAVSSEGLLQASPLLGVPVDPVLLHFEINDQGAISSPEVPEGKNRSLAMSSGLSEQWLQTGETRLSQLRDLLAAKQASKEEKALDSVLERQELKVSRANLIALNAALDEEEPVVKKSDALEKKSEKPEKKTSKWSSKAKESLSDYGDKKNRQVLKEQAALQNVALDSSKRYRKSEIVAQKAEIKKNPPASPKSIAFEELDDAFVDPSDPYTVSGVALEQEQDEGLGGNRSFYQVGSSAMPFRSLWLEGELLLIREVYIGQKKKLQGVWLNGEKLKANLLQSVSDLLPYAQLLPIERFITEQNGSSVFTMKALPIDENPMSLVSFPIVLDPGSVEANSKFTKLAWKPLAGAWLATILGLLAVAALLAGVMKMSARRAAFVSAVTHELRTPLTTFKLYSDMLAGGMIKNEDTKKEYLSTLTKEADRLGHLVENVLAYSKIEKGSARAQLRSECIENHIQAMETRLRSRVHEEGAYFLIKVDDEAAESILKVDYTALEQIIFNLIDNACKYGCEQEGARVILKVQRDDSFAYFRVIDEGKGISKAEKRKLFRAFHKSAEDAANSKPGVGLGLALCRRLAKALGGDLTIEKPGKPGAKFCLKVPFQK